MTAPARTAADAVLALLRAVGTPTGSVTWFDGHVPSSTPTKPLPTRYGVLYPRTPLRQHEDLAHTSDLWRVEFQITSVGATRPEAQWIADRAADALVDRRLVIAGLSCEPVEHVDAQPLRWDDAVPGRVVVYGTDQYGFNATVAPAAA